MWDIFQTASDDQIALAFCGLALFISGAVMYLSHPLGQWARGQHAAPIPTHPIADHAWEAKEKAA